MDEHDPALIRASVVITANLQVLLAAFDRAGLDTTLLLEIWCWTYSQGYITDTQELTEKGYALLNAGVREVDSL